MNIIDDNTFLNYRGLYEFLEKLKSYFIKNPSNRAAGKYLRCVNADGTVEWADFPAVLTFKGVVENYEQLPSTDNSPGDVWKVESTGAEYYWALNQAGTAYSWEYLGELINLPNHARITDTATVGQILVSRSNGSSITYEWKTLLEVPTILNLLIYSDDGQNLTTHLLMFVDGLVVDNATDLARCMNQSDFSMEEVARSWSRHIMNYKDPLWGISPATYDSLGTIESAGDSSTSAINAWHYVDKNGVDTRLYNGATTLATDTYTLSTGEVLDYIYNYNNPSTSTMLCSQKKYGSYYNKMAIGIVPSKNLSGYTDRIATIPMLLLKNNYLYLIEVYTNNYHDSEGWIVSGNMTVGIAVRRIPYKFPNSAIDKNCSCAKLILTGTEGLSVVPFNANLDNYNLGSESAIVLETIYKGSQLILGFSLPYSNDGSIHDDEVPILTNRRVTIDFEDYTLVYTDVNGTSHTKDFSGDSLVKDVFDALRGLEVNRAFMQDSSPGCVWRNIANLDGGTILDITEGEDKVYMFDGMNWVEQNTTPLTMFKNGSRIAWNSITNKLFYNDGTNIYKITPLLANPDWNATSGAALILNKPTIPTESTVYGWGFTKNIGTITLVGNTSSGQASVTSYNNTASFGLSVTVGNVGGVDLKFTMPANPNTDTQADWNESDTTSAAYINNKPTIPAAQIQSDWNLTDNTQVDFIKNKPTIPAAQVNADWNASSGVAEILNKPSLATVATSGNYSDLSGTPNLAAVATSGSYNDLTNTPTIPAAQVNADWTASSGVAEILHKPNLATIATSGSYNDLTNKPSIPPAANNGKLTIKKDSSDTGTEFTADLSTDVTCNLGLAAVATSGSYADLSNTPAIPAALILSDWDLTDNTSLDYIKNKPCVTVTLVLNKLNEPEQV